MKHFARKANNYWQTLKKKESKQRSRKVMWWVFRLVLVSLRLLCKITDLFNGCRPDD